MLVNGDAVDRGGRGGAAGSVTLTARISIQRQNVTNLPSVTLAGAACNGPRQKRPVSASGSEPAREPAREADGQSADQQPSGPALPAPGCPGLPRARRAAKNKMGQNIVGVDNVPLTRLAKRAAGPRPAARLLFQDLLRLRFTL